MPSSRYNASAFYHPDRDRRGTINSTSGYFINEDIKDFENSFFGISNVEAVNMDPQQRKLLEVVFECFENAGATLETLSGANVGCYVGNFCLDYSIMQLSDTETINRYTAAGATPTLLANRISHVFNLHGPSFVLDTGCSSSLYSLHCACSALDLKECDAAVVASANLIQLPQQQVLANKTGIISDSATCRTFDASANGYGRAEGVGALYLKRLSDALRNGDPIRAVIRGTAANSNGNTPGVMQPSSNGQERVMRQAYDRAGLSVNGTDYVEAHGTGTAVGDPIEVDAISRVFSQKTGNPVLVGSVKTNVGHSEAASGITSVIKVVLSMENRIIPPTINIKTLNPELSKPEFRIEIVRSLMPWPKAPCPRASINSFGFGGANSHAILEAFPSTPLQEGPVHGQHGFQHVKRTFLIPISAHSIFSFERRTNDLQGLRLDSAHSTIGSLAYTMSDRRTRLQYRGYLLAEAPYNTGQLNIKCVSGPVFTTPVLPIAFVCTGQGAQWTGMGCNLFAHYEIFRNSIEAQDSHLSSCGASTSWTLTQLLSDSLPVGMIDVNQPDVSQVLCTAVQVAIIDLLEDWSVRPAAVVGHSSGEIAAAYAAGYLSRREAILLAYYRGISISARSNDLGQGSMLAIGMNKTQVLHYVNELGLAGQVDLACVNSPHNVTMSGDVDGIDCLKAKMDNLKIFNRILRTNAVAYHSHHMRHHVGGQYQNLIAKHLDLSSTPKGITGVTMVSTVTGHALTVHEARRPSYWCDNLEKTVQFHDALTRLFETRKVYIIEIGPHPALQIPIKEVRASMPSLQAYLEDAYCCTLFRAKDELRSMLDLVGALFSQGHEPNFSAINQLQQSEKRVLTSLPTYAWDYENVVPWKEPRTNMELRNRRYSRHELLGSQITGGSGMTLVWRNIISTQDVPWLPDHRFGPTILFPAAGFISMVIEAICQANDILLSDCPNVFLRQIKFTKALPVPDNGNSVELFTELRKLPISNSADSTKWWQFNIVSVVEGQHVGHVSGRVACYEFDKVAATRHIVFSDDTMESQSMSTWYRRLSQAGLNGGPSFKVIEEVYVDRLKQKQEAHSKLWLRRGDQNTSTSQYEYVAHPTVIDAMLQTGFIAATAGRPAKVQCLLPVSIEQIDVISSTVLDYQSDNMWSIRTRAVKTGFAATVTNAELHSPGNNVLFRIQRARSTIYQGNWETGLDEPRVPNLRVCWKPDITFVRSGHDEKLATYLCRAEERCDLNGECFDMLSECLDLLAHKRPNEKFVFLNLSESTLKRCMDILGIDQSFKRFAALHCGNMDRNGNLVAITSPLGQGSKSNDEVLQLSDYDVVVADFREDVSLVHPLHAAASPAVQLVLLLGPDSAPIVRSWDRTALITTMNPPHGVVAIIGGEALPPSVIDEVYLVGIDGGSELDQDIQKHFHHQHGANVIFVPFGKIETSSIPSGSHVILSVEGEKSIMEQMTPDDLRRLQNLTSAASSIFWVTRGNLLKASRPENVLAWGAARAIRLEEPQLQLATFDFDESSDLATTASNIFIAFHQAFSSNIVDLEYIEHEGIVHVSRWIPDDPLNIIFQEKQDMHPSEAQFGHCGHIELSIETPGQLDTIRFDSQDHPRTALIGDEIEVEAKCYGMNAKVSRLP